MYTELFKLYKEAIVRAYRDRQARETHLDWLIRPTRVRIRRRSLDLVHQGLGKQDEPMLYSFLEMRDGRNDYGAVLDDWDSEDFKTMELFMKQTNIETAEKNVEFLAWLVDFEPRPFKEFKKQYPQGLPWSEEPETVTEDGPDQPAIGPETKEPESAGGDAPVLPGHRPVQLLGEDWGSQPQASAGPPSWWPFAGAAALLLGVFLLWSLTGREECMYWDNDHYVAGACSTPKLDTSLVALDRARLSSFYRIKRVDTLTGYAVGRFWYARVGDSIEVFSSAGKHPLYPDKPLKKVTDYILNVCHRRY